MLATHLGRRPVLVARCLLCVGLAAPVGAAGADLGDVVGRAIATNPDVAEAVNQWQARRAEVRQARAGYRPTLDLNAGYGYEYTNSPGTRAAGGSEELDRTEFGLNARQMLFDGYGTRSEVERQEARRDSAAARVSSVAEAVAMRTTEAYVGLLRSRQVRQLSEESLGVHLRIQEQIRARSAAGVGRRADRDQVDARVALAKANLVAADVNLRDAETTFQREVGVLPEGAYEPAVVVPGLVPASLEEALQLAQARNPVLQTAAADIQAAQAQHEAAKQFNYPRFDLEVGGNLDDDIDGAEGYRNDFSAMVRMRYNLYRGGADAARIRETAYNINEAEEVRNRTRRQLEESVRLAWAAFEATGAQVPLLQQQIEAALATRDAYAKQFNIGQRTLLDLLNSENEVLQARQALVGAEADRVLAQYRILEATGGLLGHFGHAPELAAED